MTDNQVKFSVNWEREAVPAWLLVALAQRWFSADAFQVLGALYSLAGDDGRVAVELPTLGKLCRIGSLRAELALESLEWAGAVQRDGVHLIPAREVPVSYRATHRAFCEGLAHV